jgi:hypothetical protein
MRPIVQIALPTPLPVCWLIKETKNYILSLSFESNTERLMRFPGTMLLNSRVKFRNASSKQCSKEESAKQGVFFQAMAGTNDWT